MLRRSTKGAGLGDGRGAGLRVMTDAERSFRRRGLKPALGLLFVLAAGAGAIFTLSDRPAAQQARPQAAPAAIPVTVAHSTRQDVPLYASGLGSVQAFNAVQVRSRVDGTLMQVPVTEGQDVKEGDILAVIDPRPYQAALDAAVAKRTQDEADLSNAQRDLMRYTSLEKSSFASRQQLDTQQAMVNRLTAQIAGDDAAISMARLNLGYCTITAPVQGRVGLRQVDPGNMVHASDSAGIISVTQIHPIAVLFTLPQDILPSINAAMAKGKLAVTALSPNGMTELDQGTLLTPDNSIDTSTGTIKLKAVFPNPNNALWPGQFVNARLLMGTERNVLTVPSTAVQHGPAGLYVYVVKPDSTVARQDVDVVRENGTVSVIAKGLEDDQVVVTDGQSRLQQGTRVAANDAKQQAVTSAKNGG
jgi:multidrug efflux system membrane fusion protein